MDTLLDLLTSDFFAFVGTLSTVVALTNYLLSSRWFVCGLFWSLAAMSLAAGGVALFGVGLGHALTCWMATAAAVLLARWTGQRPAATPDAPDPEDAGELAADMLRKTMPDGLDLDFDLV